MRHVLLFIPYLCSPTPKFPHTNTALKENTLSQEKHDIVISHSSLALVLFPFGLHDTVFKGSLP